MRAKSGELKARWSKKENDIMYAWGGCGADSSDAHLLHMALTNTMKFSDKSFQEELEERGYDISTLKFSIQRKK